MSTTTAYAPGTFCWPELVTTDQDGARSFYTKLFGWASKESPMGEGETYTILLKEDRAVGALCRKRPEEPVPNWHAYVSVADAKQSVEKAKQLGGTVMMEPFDVMDLGIMAPVMDPTGAVVFLWQAKSMRGVDVMDEPGSLVWTELMTRDVSKAKAFYTGLFGWSTREMGADMGNYVVFQRGSEDRKGAGGMMGMPQQAPADAPSFWLPYFSVHDCDATSAKAQSLGAKLKMPPTDIPTVGRFSVIEDPQGATFCILKTLPM